MRMGKALIWIGLLAMMVFTSLSGGGYEAPNETMAVTAPEIQLISAEIPHAHVAPPTPFPTPEPTPAHAEPPEPSPEPLYSESDAEMLAKTVYGEAGICSVEEQRLVVWTVLQRVDAGGYGDTIEEVITAKYQFFGYGSNNPVEPEIYALCMDELEAWQSGAEPPTHEVYAPTAPYYFFDGDGRHNWYRENYR